MGSRQRITWCAKQGWVILAILLTLVITPNLLPQPGLTTSGNDLLKDIHVNQHDFSTNTCGVAAATMVLDYYLAQQVSEGPVPAITMQAVAKYVKYSPLIGTYPDQIKTGLEQISRAPEIQFPVPLNADQWKLAYETDWFAAIQTEIDAGRPIIVFLPDGGVFWKHAFKYGHFIVVSGYAVDKSITYHDPWDGNAHTVSNTDFGKALPNPGKYLRITPAAVTPTPTITPTPIPTTKQVQYKNVSFSYDPSLATNVTGETVPANPTGSGMAIDAMPEHIKFRFEGFPVTRNQWDEPTFLILPVEEYEKTLGLDYFTGNVAVDVGAMVTPQVDNLSSLLTERPDLRAIYPPFLSYEEEPTFQQSHPRFGAPHPPFLPVPMGGLNFTAKPGFEEFGGGEGISFITMFVQQQAAIDGREMYYVFQGLTHDKKYYVSATFPVSSIVSLGDPPPYTEGISALWAYNKRSATTLDSISKSDYIPNLDLFDNLVKSITIETPPPTPTLTPTITPVASPNEIAYISPDGDLWITNIDGTNARKTVSGPVARPVWSHDGTKIAYVREPSGAPQVEIANADGTGTTVVAVSEKWPTAPQDQLWYPSFRRVRWSPDDSSIYYLTFAGRMIGSWINRYDLATGKVSSADDINPQNMLNYVTDFDIATDGTVLSFSYQNFKNQLYLLPAGGQLKGLLGENSATWIDAIAWSADGSRAAVNFGGTSQVISIVRPREPSVTPTPITELGPGSRVEAIAWSPDGTTLAYDQLSGDPKVGSIWIIPATGGKPTKLFDGKNPAWRPSIH